MGPMSHAGRLKITKCRKGKAEETKMRSFMYVALLFLVFATGCTPATPRTAKYFVIGGSSSATIDEAVREAQLAITNAAGNGCQPISIGGGTGAGLGIGLCSNPAQAIDPSEVPPCIEKKEVQVSYDVHVLVKCPNSITNLLRTGIAQ